MIKKTDPNTLVSSVHGHEYVSPAFREILFQPEGAQCISVGVCHEDYSEGGHYEL